MNINIIPFCQEPGQKHKILVDSRCAYCNDLIRQCICKTGIYSGGIHDQPDCEIMKKSNKNYKNNIKK